jgi:FkbM family methyltransferase
MNEILKKFLKKTPLYFLYNYWRGKYRLQRSISEFWEWSEEDERRLLFFKQFIRPGELVFDVGANRGMYTRIFLKLGAEVVAFEPQKRCTDRLEPILQRNRNFTLVKKALGKSEGQGKMFLADADVLSTLSDDWPRMTKQSGRFPEREWRSTQPVEIITLDIAVKDWGVPSFIKIDVEGYEYEVLSGLSQPVENIAFEFVSENIENAFRCIDYMNSNFTVSFQLCMRESMKLELQSWVKVVEIKKILSGILSRERLPWGDIYVRGCG